MAIKINGAEVTAEGCDWGVEFHDPTTEPWVYEAEDEEDARRIASETRGRVVVREVYVTAWAEADG